MQGSCKSIDKCHVIRKYKDDTKDLQSYRCASLSVSQSVMMIIQVIPTACSYDVKIVMSFSAKFFIRPNYYKSRWSCHPLDLRSNLLML